MPGIGIGLGVALLNGKTYSPAQEQGGVVGYDFSVIAGLSDSDPITTLTDLSGNGRTLTFDATKQPLWKANILNGLGAALFDGTNDQGYTAAFGWGSNEGAIYALFTSASGSDNMMFYFGPTSGDGRIVLYRANSGPNETALTVTNNSALSYSLSGAANPLTTTPKVISGRFDLDDAIRVKQYHNGVAVGTPTNGTTGTANFGSNYVLTIGNQPAGTTNGLNGYLHEIWAFNVQHDLTTHARVVEYFRQKYFPAGFNFGVSDFADNAYTVTASQTSPAARVVIETDADVMCVETVHNIAAPDGLYDCGVRLDGADLGVMEANTANTKGLYTFGLGSAGTTRTVELINGIQSKPASTRMGQFIKSAFFNGSATVVSASEATTPRIMMYGDSMMAGQAATNPSLQGVVQLVRDAYAATGSVISEAWGYRKLKDDCPDVTSAQAFAEHIATVAPTIFYSGIGYNDLGAWTAAAFQTALDDFVVRLNTELPSLAIYLQGPLVQATDTGLPDFRTACSNVATAHSGYCTYVDPTDAAFPQGINGHPSTAEQAQWATAIEGILGL